MGKGNDPNCKITTHSAGAAVAVLQPETPQQQEAINCANKLGLIEYRMTERTRRGADQQRRVTDGASAINRSIDSYGLLAEYERTVTMVAQHHPVPEVQERAKRLVIACNQRAANKAAFDMAKVWGRYGFTHEEFYAEALEGLRDGIDQFDNTKDVKFLTYAIPKMTMRLNRFVENNSERIYGRRLPTERFWEVHKVRRTFAYLESALSEDVDADTIIANREDPSVKAKLGKMADLSDEDLRAKIAWAQSLSTGRSLSEKLRSDDAGGDDLGSTLADDGIGTADLAQGSALMDQIRSIARDALDDEQLAYMGATDFAGLGLVEDVEPADNNSVLAERHSVPEARVRARLRAARDQLRDALASNGMTPEALFAS